MPKSASPKGPSNFVREAYRLDNDEKIVDFYSKWADEYDHQMLEVLGYTSPMSIARLLCEFLPKKIHVLSILAVVRD